MDVLITKLFNIFKLFKISGFFIVTYHERFLYSYQFRLVSKSDLYSATFKKGFIQQCIMSSGKLVRFTIVNIII